MDCSSNRFSSVYLAPSQDGYGWGVFSSRSFQKGDIVDVAPMFLRVDLEDNRNKVLKETVLNNYHYEYWGWDGILGKVSQYSMVAFGMSLYYNHQSPLPTVNQAMASAPLNGVGPNIKQRKVGQEPDMDHMERAVAIVYYALRDIQKGEELLVDYGGSEWFRGRGLQEIARSKTFDAAGEDSTHQHNHLIMKQLSGKIYAGYHKQAFRRVMECLADSCLDETSPFRLDTILPHLPNNKACFGSVTSMTCIEEGETIEYVPALLLQLELVRSTLLESLIFPWNDFDDSSQIFPTSRPKSVHIQYQDDSEKPTPVSFKLQIPREKSCVLALAGHISMMARTCGKDSGLHNAVLQIEEDSYNEFGYCVRAVACRTIEPGERIVLAVSQFDCGSEPIIQELCVTGQPFECLPSNCSMP